MDKITITYHTGFPDAPTELDLIANVLNNGDCVILDFNECDVLHVDFVARLVSGLLSHFTLETLRERVTVELSNPHRRATFRYVIKHYINALE